MPRSTGTQIRTFNYNNTAFLQSATNPENGTVNYTYAASGALATKIDAKGQKVVYTYDSYNRLFQVQRYPAPGTVEDICQRVGYYYDTDPFPGAFSQYAWGRRTGVEYGNASVNYCSDPFAHPIRRAVQLHARGPGDEETIDGDRQRGYAGGYEPAIEEPGYRADVR
jgi:YD repeat-containing protein